MQIPHHILQASGVDEAVDLLLRDARESGASEVVFEPSSDNIAVRLRRDGLVHEWFRLSKTAYGKMVVRLQMLARMREEANLSMQEKALRRTAFGSEIESAFCTVPVSRGEKAVLRFRLPRRSLEDLGLTAEQRGGLVTFLKRNSGLLLLVGPRRSGCTTALYALLERAAGTGRSVSLIEADSEADLRGIDQETIDPVSGRVSSLLVRAAVARGARIIGLGGLRDEASAALAVSAAEHRLVIAVVEGQTFSEALSGMLEMRVDPDALASVLMGVLTQRLGRRVCPECLRLRETPLEEAARKWPRPVVRALFGKEKKQTFAYAGKCSRCWHTGHRGQIGIFEWRDLAKLQHDPSTLLADAARKALAGLIAPEELLRL